MECPKCLDTRGLCGHGNVLKDKFFYLTLPEGFKDMAFIPCFARAYLLKKLAVATFQKTTVKAHLKTEEGFNFKVMLTNENGRTFFTGQSWKEFAKCYQLEVGTELYLDLGKRGLDIPVDLANLPITHPLSKETRRVVNMLDATDGTTITWIEMEHVIDFVDNIEFLVDRYNAGPQDGPYVPLVHSLNKSNFVKKLLKISRRVVPEMMDEYGEMTIVVHPKTQLRSTYSTSPVDGRVIVNGWRELLKQYPDLEIGDRMLFVLHHGRAGAFLFVSCILDPDEE